MPYWCSLIGIRKTEHTHTHTIHANKVCLRVLSICRFPILLLINILYRHVDSSTKMSCMCLCAWMSHAWKTYIIYHNIILFYIILWTIIVVTRRICIHIIRISILATMLSQMNIVFEETYQLWIQLFGENLVEYFYMRMFRNVYQEFDYSHFHSG